MRKIIIAAIIASVSLLACSKDFDTMNTDPTQFTTATPEAALQGAFKRLNDFMGANNTNRWWDIAHLVNAGSRYNTDDAGLWQNIYVNTLQPVSQVKSAYGSDPNFNNRVQIARVWECYAYSIAVSNFGPSPRKQALSTTQLSTIMYDPEDSVYAYILSTLKDAAAKIDVTKTQDRLLYDAIYAPNATAAATALVNWKKFANTLRLKIALRCSKNLPELSQAAIREVMADEANTISSEAETAKMNYENVSNNEAPYYARYIRTTYTGTDIPAMSDAMFLFFRSYKDPRIDAYFDSVPRLTGYQLLMRDTLASKADDSLRIVQYRIPHLGKPKATNTLPGWTATAGQLSPLDGAGLTTYSRIKGWGFSPTTTLIAPQSPAQGLLAPDRPFIILSYAEAQFLKAEAAALALGGSKTAEQYYYEGIDANFAFWKITNLAARDAYKARDGIKWGTTGSGFADFVNLTRADIPADGLTKIYVQEWLNYFPDQAFDSWCLERRTRAVQFLPHTNPNNGVVSVPYMEIPLRGTYPANNINLNPIGYTDALSQLGVQQVELNPYIALKFVKDYTVPDWNAKPARYNGQFIQKWYGTTIQDLTAAGISYTLLSTFKP